MSKSYRVKCQNCSAVTINGHAAHEQGCHGHMEYIDKRGRVFVKYDVWSLDVWGNARDGFEVNDRQRCGSIMVSILAEDKDVIRALKRADLLSRRCHFNSFRVDDTGIESAKTGEPIYQLERV